MYFLQTMVSAVLVSTASATSDIKKAADADQPGNAIYKGKQQYFTIGFDRVKTISAKTGELRESTEIFLSCKNDTNIKFQLSKDGKSIWRTNADFHQSKKEFGIERYIKNGSTGTYKWIDAARFEFKNEAKVSWKATLVQRFNELLRHLQLQIPTEIKDAIDAVERAAEEQRAKFIKALDNIAAENNVAKYVKGISCAIGYMKGLWEGEQEELRKRFMENVKSLRAFNEMPSKDVLESDFKKSQNALLEQQENEIETLRTKITEYTKKLHHLDGEEFTVEMRKLMYRRHIADAFNRETDIIRQYPETYGTEPSEPTRRRLMDAERIRKHAVLRELHQ